MVVWWANGQYRASRRSRGNGWGALNSRIVRLTITCKIVQVHAALPSNTLAIYGPGQTKELTELVPGILNQLGPDSLANLRRLAESYQSLTARQAAAAAGSGGEGAGEAKEGEGDDEIPDLVDNFDEAEVKKSDLEELE